MRLRLFPEVLPRTIGLQPVVREPILPRLNCPLLVGRPEHEAFRRPCHGLLYAHTAYRNASLPHNAVLADGVLLFNAPMEFRKPCAINGRGEPHLNVKDGFGDRGSGEPFPVRHSSLAWYRRLPVNGKTTVALPSRRTPWE